MVDIINKDNIKMVHGNLFFKVLDKQYFLDTFAEVCKSTKPPETNKDIIYFWNKFWEMLPDNKSIRRDPFYEICDIAECIFIIDEFEE